LTARSVAPAASLDQDGQRLDYIFSRHDIVPRKQVTACGGLYCAKQETFRHTHSSSALDVLIKLYYIETVTTHSCSIERLIGWVQYMFKNRELSPFL